MEILLPVLYALLFILLIYKIKFFSIQELSRTTLTIVYVLKIIIGTIVWWVYTYHYSNGDLHGYFNEGNILFHLLIKAPKLFYNVVFDNTHYSELQMWNSSYNNTLYNDAHTLSLLNMVFRFFSFGYFHVHTVFMCFLSLIGLTALYKTFIKYFLPVKKLFFISVFLIPSVLFWSSGVLKEGLLFFGMGLLLYSSNCGLKTEYDWRKFGMVTFSIGILMVIKFYVLIALLPGLLLNMIVSRTSDKKLLLKSIIVSLALFIVVILFSLADDRYNPLYIIVDKQAKSISESQGGVFLANDKYFVSIDYDKQSAYLQLVNSKKYKIKSGSSYLQWSFDNMSDTTFINNSTDTSGYSHLYTISPAGSMLSLTRLQSTFSSFLINSPKAVFNVMLYPLIWNINDWIQIIPSLENIFFLLFILLAILFLKTNIENKPILIFCLSFALILFILIGLTTPATGAIIRYKTPALPFLMFALLLLIDKQKLLKVFPFLSKIK